MESTSIFILLNKWNSNPMIYKDGRKEPYKFAADEFFIPRYLHKSKSLSHKQIISNYGTVIDVTGTPKEMAKWPSGNKNKYDAVYVGHNHVSELLHRSVYFSFLYYMIMNNNQDPRLLNHVSLQMIYNDVLYAKNHNQDVAIHRMNKLIDATNKKEIHHINHICTDNRLINLEFDVKYIHIILERIADCRPSVYNSDMSSDEEAIVRKSIDIIAKDIDEPFAITVSDSGDVSFKLLKYINFMDKNGSKINSIDNVMHFAQREAKQAFLKTIVAIACKFDNRLLDGKYITLVFSYKDISEGYKIMIDRGNVSFEIWYPTVDESEMLNVDCNQNIILINYHGDEKIVKFSA